jgi:dTDP-4-amino-4,6-dideoxygalactose transaminase
VSTKTVKFLSLKAQHDVLQSSFEETFRLILSDSNFILGERLRSFEGDFARYSETSFCIGVASGLDALTIAITALNIGSGEEVIVPANTYFATWLAIANAGATIVPAEPLPDTYNIDPASVRSLISEKTRAIIPVHLYGQPCDMKQLVEISRKNNIDIIEDNAQAHGAKWDGKRTGSFGKINATSFYPTKNLGALGDGGAVTTSDEQLATFARTYRNYGSDAKNYFEMAGVNSRLDEVQAAFLNCKLKHIDDWNNQRRTLAEMYSDRLSQVSEIRVPHCPPQAYHVYHLYVVRAQRRNDLRLFLNEHGIETMIHYPIAPYEQKAFRHLGFRKSNFPVTEQLVSSSVSLPLWPGMSVDDVDFVCDAIKKFYRAR